MWYQFATRNAKNRKPTIFGKYVCKSLEVYYSDSMPTKAARIVKYIWLTLMTLIALSIIGFLVINFAIIQTSKDDIFQIQRISTPLDIAIVLGASVEWLQLSPILQDRIETAIELYQGKKVKKIFVSWDNGKKYYNEVDAMHNYLRNRGIPEPDIITDTKWFTTYESLKNFKTYLQQNNFLEVGIITQAFHLPRAIFIAKSIWIDATGIISDRAIYKEEKYYEKRESLARIKAIYDILVYHLIKK